MNYFRKTPAFLLALLVLAGCEAPTSGETPTTTSSMPIPAEFASAVLAGGTSPETFDFDTHGFWRLAKNEQMTWFAGVAEPLGFGKPAADGCAIDEQRKYAAMMWTILATQAADAADWRLNALALRVRLAELDAHLSRAAPATPGADPLTQELLVRFARDQGVRAVFTEPRWTIGLPPLALMNWGPTVATRMGAIDCDNTAWLRKQLASIGWFSIPKYRAEADSAAWHLVQHADLTRDFQQEMLVKLEALPRGDTDPKRIGYLWDRVALSEGRPQRYGTQGRCDADGTWKPFDSEDPAHLDERRKSLGMVPIAQHAKVVWRESCPK